ncbi:MAG TPA: 50S ribosomal protein L4 [Rhabdochlamydiaceae bacterium]|nr:50S ribosomal protein L4 [Rhabdochlamydiaceae bacterium]
MAVLKKYNLAGLEVGEVSLEDALINATANTQMIKDYLIALRANARQWSANTKTRAEVCHSGKKPHPQKGTGRARQGYLGAPQYKGGGRVHAPRPKFNQHVRVNKKERRAAIKHLISEKIQEQKIHVLQYEEIDSPRTKTVSQFLRNRNLEGSRVLFVSEGFIKQSGDQGVASLKYDNFLKSINNLQKVEFLSFQNINGYDLAKSHEIVFMENALDELKMLLGSKS